MVLAIAHTASYTKSAVLDFVSRKTVAHFATALIRYVFRYFGLGSLSLTRRPAQNPLSWILFHKMQMFTSLRCRSLCILLLRVYASLRTTQNPQFGMTIKRTLNLTMLTVEQKVKLVSLSP